MLLALASRPIKIEEAARLRQSIIDWRARCAPVMWGRWRQSPWRSPYRGGAAATASVPPSTVAAVACVRLWVHAAARVSICTCAHMNVGISFVLSSIVNANVCATRRGLARVGYIRYTSDVRHVRRLGSRARVGYIRYTSDVRHVSRLARRVRDRCRRNARRKVNRTVNPLTRSRRVPCVDAHVRRVKKVGKPMWTTRRCAHDTRRASHRQRRGPRGNRLVTHVRKSCFSSKYGRMDGPT